MKSRVLLKGQALEEYNKLKSIIKEEKANGINRFV
jgi:hypothetical protein